MRNLAHRGRHRTRHHHADIVLVGDVSSLLDYLSIEEDGHDENRVVEMRYATVARVVRNENVPIVDRDVSRRKGAKAATRCTFPF
jgi:hypothetical protein